MPVGPLRTLSLKRYMERAMDVSPVALELVAREVGQATEAEDELHHETLR